MVKSLFSVEIHDAQALETERNTRVSHARGTRER